MLQFLLPERHRAVAIDAVGERMHPLLHSPRELADATDQDDRDAHGSARGDDGDVQPSVLCQLGHVASVQQLAAHGVSASVAHRAVRTGAAMRLRRGVYACAHLDPTLAFAARLGGALTCVSVLRPLSIWSGHARGVHLQLPPHSSPASIPEGADRVHWVAPRFGMATPFLATSAQALWQALRCLDDEDAIAALESAVHEKVLTMSEARRIGRLGPRRLESGVRELIPDSGSGNETIVRRRLVRVGYRVQAQGRVPGLGRQDLVIEDCVGLDVDGRAWHGEDRFVVDRDRDLISEGLGRHVLRLHAGHIHQSWPTTLAVIDRVVADALRARERRGG